MSLFEIKSTLAKKKTCFISDNSHFSFYFNFNEVTKTKINLIHIKKRQTPSKFINTLTKMKMEIQLKILKQIKC